MQYLNLHDTEIATSFQENFLIAKNWICSRGILKGGGKAWGCLLSRIWKGGKWGKRELLENVTYFYNPEQNHSEFAHDYCIFFLFRIIRLISNLMNKAFALCNTNISQYFKSIFDTLTCKIQISRTKKSNLNFPHNWNSGILLNFGYIYLKPYGLKYENRKQYNLFQPPKYCYAPGEKPRIE